VNMPKPPLSRHLYVDDLARKLEAIESGRKPMDALSYRVHAKMLRIALKDYPTAGLDGHAGEVWPVMEDAMANRCFESTGQLPTVGGRAIKRAADELINRCRLARLA